MAAAAALLTACGGGDKAPATPDTQVDTPAATDTSVETTAGTTAGYSADRNAYFGDLHIHTKNSFDAYIFNVRTTPDDAYRYAKGETIKHPSGYDIKLEGPAMDFYAVTDHGSYLGILPAMNDPDNAMSESHFAKTLFSTDPTAITNAFQSVGASVRSGDIIPEMDNRAITKSVWQETQDAADRHNEPGKLTTFSAYEYTSVTNVPGEDGTFGGGNLHRNVFFKGNAPDDVFSTLDSTNPEDLWDWMDTQRAAGMDVIAAPHNSNVSDGLMFDDVTYNGDPLTAAYAEQRMRNEPIVEMTQVKGFSETHPALSPNDEFADEGIYEKLLGSYITSQINGSYVREALGNGLMMQDQQGFNPYKFGMIGSTDSHVAGGAMDEENYWSKVGIVDGLAVSRGSVPPGGAKTWEGLSMDQNAEKWFSKWSASGYAVVWAEENTRESIFAAMRRKETYATTGPRMTVRFFGGYGLSEDMLSDPDAVSKAYAGGVPMGGDIDGNGEAPTFLTWAMRDPRGAPLDRIQIIKVYSEGTSQNESIFDVACSDGRDMDPATRRCSDNGASVDLSDCSISADSGAPELRAAWQDPDFDPAQRAVYYVRVLENPTCRWSTWDANKAGVERNPDLAATVKERAYTSPIWYNPTR